MNIPLLKLTFKQNYKLFIIFLLILAMYVSIIIGMYNPDDIEALVAMTDAIPKEMMAAFGFDGAITNLTTFLASWLYGFIVFIFPTVYCLILCNKLIVKTVDNGSMVTLLSTPISRKTIVTTKALYSIMTVIILQIFVTILGIVICNSSFPDALDTTAFIKLNISAGLVNLTTMAIAFFFSSLCNLTSQYMIFGAGIPLVSFIFKMIGGITKDIEFFKYISYFSWYDSVELVNGGNVTNINIIYLCIIFVLFLSSVFIFNRKQLII